ncbi:MAG: hypothetical protein ACXW19_10435 [Thermoanaerobaculia bacterium]
MVEVPSWRRGLSLLTPFALCAAFFAGAANELWLVALFCTMALSFVTYGSISHDLVHRNLRLPRLTNDVLLCAIELLTLRSGHAYQFTHLSSSVPGWFSATVAPHPRSKPASVQM